MKLFLVVNSTNISLMRDYWEEVSIQASKGSNPLMRIYLSGTNGRRSLLVRQLAGENEELNIYLSGTGVWKYALDGKRHLSLDSMGRFYVLESFAYIKADDILIPLIPYFKGFMLDSGAFTFLQQQKQKNIAVDFDAYLDKYITFIQEQRISQFFELDIDPIVGYDKVKEYRKRLEQRVGMQCIPVWHRSRGRNEFLRLCDEYPYVALGGIAIGEIKQTEHKYFSWFIREAHRRGAKIHGLGYTNLKGLRKYHFDSVDSSSWTSGNRFGHVYRFNGRTLEKIPKPEGTRVNPQKTAVNNFTEWVKFAQYAEKHF